MWFMCIIADINLLLYKSVYSGYIWVIVPTDALVYISCIIHIGTHFFRSLLRDNRETGRRLARLYKILKCNNIVCCNRLFYSLYFIFYCGTYTIIMMIIIWTACAAAQNVCRFLEARTIPANNICLVSTR